MTPDRPKVVHVIVPAPLGGAEVVVRNLALGARNSAFVTEVAPIVQDTSADPFVDSLRVDGTPVHPVGASTRRYRQEIRRLATVLEATAADLVHTHVYHANFVGYWAARHLGIPVVATVHGFTGGDWKNRMYEWLDLRFLRWFDGVACVSEHIRDRVMAAGSRRDRVVVVPNGIVRTPLLSRSEARSALGEKGDRPLIGWIGRLSREKGADLLVCAIAECPLPRPGVVLIGDGAERQRIEQLIAAKQLGVGSVRLVGERPNAASLLAAFDVLVLSSRAEGTPMVLLEAMAARVPVVSFAVGGIPNVLDSRSGWLVPAGDAKALGAAVCEVLGDPVSAARRAEAAYQTFQDRYTAARAAEAHGEFYRVVLDGVTKRSG